jgi:hypothetical protein
MLVNPAAMALTKPLYDFFSIPLSIVIANEYLGVDLVGTVLVGSVNGGSGELGLRILPRGSGVSGPYIEPRIGGGYPVGFMAVGEVGWTWTPGHLAITVGAGAGIATEVGFFPYGNIGFGFSL